MGAMTGGEGEGERSAQEREQKAAGDGPSGADQKALQVRSEVRGVRCEVRG